MSNSMRRSPNNTTSSFSDETLNKKLNNNKMNKPIVTEMNEKVPSGSNINANYIESRNNVSNYNTTCSAITSGSSNRSIRDHNEWWNSSTVGKQLETPPPSCPSSAILDSVKVQPMEWDVLCIKDKTWARHRGNITFRELILQYAPDYVRSNKLDKMKLTRTVVDEMKTKYNSRFLRTIKKKAASTTSKDSKDSKDNEDPKGTNSQKDTNDSYDLSSDLASQENIVSNKINETKVSYSLDRAADEHDEDEASDGEETEQWEIITDKMARDKASHAFRFAVKSLVNVDSTGGSGKVETDQANVINRDCGGTTGSPEKEEERKPIHVEPTKKNKTLFTKTNKKSHASLVSAKKSIAAKSKVISPTLKERFPNITTSQLSGMTFPEQLYSDMSLLPSFFGTTKSSLSPAVSETQSNSTTMTHPSLLVESSKSGSIPQNDVKAQCHLSASVVTPTLTPPGNSSVSVSRLSSSSLSPPQKATRTISQSSLKANCSGNISPREPQLSPSSLTARSRNKSNQALLPLPSPLLTLSPSNSTRKDAEPTYLPSTISPSCWNSDSYNNSFNLNAPSLLHQYQQEDESSDHLSEALDHFSEDVNPLTTGGTVPTSLSQDTTIDRQQQLMLQLMRQPIIVIAHDDDDELDKCDEELLPGVPDEKCPPSSHNDTGTTSNCPDAHINSNGVCGGRYRHFFSRTNSAMSIMSTGSAMSDLSMTGYSPNNVNKECVAGDDADDFDALSAMITESFRNLLTFGQSFTLRKEGSNRVLGGTITCGDQQQNSHFNNNTTCNNNHRTLLTQDIAGTNESTTVVTNNCTHIANNDSSVVIDRRMQYQMFFPRYRTLHHHVQQQQLHQQQQLNHHTSPFTGDGTYQNETRAVPVNAISNMSGMPMTHDNIFPNNNNTYNGLSGNTVTNTTSAPMVVTMSQSFRNHIKNQSFNRRLEKSSSGHYSNTSFRSIDVAQDFYY